MNKEKKSKMIQLRSQINACNQTKNKFYSFVLDNIDSFDKQDWSMFCNSVNLIVDEMKQDIHFWKQIYAKVKDINFSERIWLSENELRTRLRTSMIQTICKQII